MLVSSAERLRNIHIGLSDISPLVEAPALTNFKMCAYYEGPITDGGAERFRCNNRGVTGRYVIIQVETNEPLQICEVKVYTGEVSQALMIQA